MKKTILALSLLLVSFSINAQEFQGKADYYFKRIFKNGEEFGVKPDADASYKKAYADAQKRASEKMFTLTFNKKEALYEKQQTLEKPNAKNDAVQVSMTFSGEGKKYMNLKDKIKIVEDDIVGQEFLIVDPLESFEWKLIDETRKIGDYTCYKAEVIIPVSEKAKKEYEEYLKKQEAKISLFPLDEPKEKKITAWYTPDIPVSLGPMNYWGLPGLILELNDGQSVVLCSKIVLSNKENVKIKVPNVGKKVSQEEFDTIHKEVMDNVYSR
ncbi:MAG: GLPGLI family protein [Flavobacterium sp.]|uniref:GLPGLI family protein n=1 Tax=Flavobacterium sp. TaxID=239 RepID=UPI003265594B